MMPKDASIKFCTISWAATRLELSLQYIRNLMKAGKLEEVPIHGHVRILTIASVEKLKKEREKKAAGK